MFKRRHRPDNEALSALLDGQLANRELDAVQAHLASCAACREHLDALRRTRDALRALPQAETPRSFRLHAADVAAPAPVRRVPVAVRAMPMLGAAAALIFIVVLEADLARGGSADRYEATGLQAMAAPTRAGTTASGAVGEIAADGGAPATAGNAARSASNPTPASNAYDSASQPPAPDAATPPASAGAPLVPEEGSPQPALGLAPEPATPMGQQAAPNAPLPATPLTQPEQPGAKSAATQPASTPVAGRDDAAPTSPNAERPTQQSRNGGSSDSSDIAYRIVEVVAAATALAAIAGAIGWRIRNRKVGP